MVRALAASPRFAFRPAALDGTRGCGDEKLIIAFSISELRGLELGLLQTPEKKRRKNN
jgi:hypothetical protein